MARYVELQCDGIVGPTHHYAGLSHGNIASEANAQSISYPRQAALQGLEKMRQVAALGVPQLVLPPHPRPHMGLLRALGFAGSMQQILAAAFRDDPKILQAAWSASGMWAANMATVSPAPDTREGKLHLSPANLASTLHRQQEAAFSRHVLQRIFGAVATIHAPLPACVALTDEGAANHLRLCREHGQEGVEVFVYGKEGSEDLPSGAASQKFPARQMRRASEAVARLHGVKQAVFVQQHPDAIAAGVFHNDVIAMSNERLLIYHEKAFLEEAAFLQEVERRLPDLQPVRITQEELPLQAAIESYFFNSQLLSLPGGGMAVIAPMEATHVPQAKAMFERLLHDARLPIRDLHYLEVRESMKNGGGPACLRLRVVLKEEELALLPAGVMYSPALHEKLAAWITRHYPAQLTVDSLRDAALAEACLQGLRELEDILALPGLYSPSEIE